MSATIPMRVLIFFLFIASPSYASNVRLKIVGLNHELEKNVRARISSIMQQEDYSDNHFQSHVREAVCQGLRPLGYYEPTINFKFENPPSLSRETIHININPGNPIRIYGDNIILKGDAITDKDYLILIKQGRPTIGEILNHGKYEKFKKSLTSLALRKGYFDADIVKSQISVIDTLHKAFWEIDFNSGSRYRFGEVRFSGSQIREEYLKNLIPFYRGDYYTVENLEELNHHLSATNWFNAVIVSPDFKNSNENKVLSLDAWVTPRTRNTIDTGIGYSTDVGPRVKGIWKRPWLNDRGHSLKTSIIVSAPEQQLSLIYKTPMLKNALEQYYLFQGEFKRVNLNDIKSVTSKVAVSRNWDLSLGWQRVVNLTWRLDRFIEENTTNTSVLLYPSVSINRTRSRGGLMPNWGDSQRYSIDVSNIIWNSNVNFALIQAQNVWIRTLSDKHRLVVRGQAGWIETNNLEKVPPDLRFFAGGDRSIRGYKYKSIAPCDREGKLIGSSKILTGSFEYQYNLIGKWWGAIFIDSGEASDNIKKSNIKTGSGLGLRWHSPVGPIKLDIAVPLGDKEAHGLQFYIGLGPEL